MPQVAAAEAAHHAYLGVGFSRAVKMKNIATLGYIHFLD